MSGHLLRETAPLGPGDWSLLDEAVVAAARAALIGRRFLSLYGPLGAGERTVAVDRFPPQEEEGTRRSFLPLTVVHRDFLLPWQDLEAHRSRGEPLDASRAAQAAAYCACWEDELIFQGDEEAGLEGLLNAGGVQRLERGDWKQPGSALAEVAKAAAALGQADCPGPYTLVLSPGLFALLDRVVPSTGYAELRLVEKAVGGEVLRSQVLPGGTAVLLDPAPYHLDLAVGEDLTTAYLGNDGLDHAFRVFESVALRLKQPAAVVVLEGGE